MHGTYMGTHVDDMHHIKAALKYQRYSAFMSAYSDIWMAAAWTCAAAILKKRMQMCISWFEPIWLNKNDLQAAP